MILSNPATKGNKVVYTYNYEPGSMWNKTNRAHFNVVFHKSQLKKSNFWTLVSVIDFWIENLSYCRSFNLHSYLILRWQNKVYIPQNPILSFVPPFYFSPWVDIWPHTKRKCWKFQARHDNPGAFVLLLPLDSQFVNVDI